MDAPGIAAHLDGPRPRAARRRHLRLGRDRGDPALQAVSRSTRASTTLASTSRVLGWLMVACFALLFFARLAPDLRRYFGASERALYAAILAWLVVIGIACATGHLGARRLSGQPLRGRP